MFENLFRKNLKYLVIGAGSVGATIACLLKGANKNVTLISKYKELINKANKQGGIRLISNIKDDKRYKINMKTEAEYKNKADVIILCVKEKDINSTFPLIEKVVCSNTVIFAICENPEIANTISERFNNVLKAEFNAKCRWYDRQNVEYMQQGEICELKLISANKNTNKQILEQIKDDLIKSGITTTLDIIL